MPIRTTHCVIIACRSADDAGERERGVRTKLSVFFVLLHWTRIELCGLNFTNMHTLKHKRNQERQRQHDRNRKSYQTFLTMPVVSVLDAVNRGESRLQEINYNIIEAHGAQIRGYMQNFVCPIVTIINNRIAEPQRPRCIVHGSCAINSRRACARIPIIIMQYWCACLYVLWFVVPFAGGKQINYVCMPGR